MDFNHCFRNVFTYIVIFSIDDQSPKVRKNCRGREIEKIFDSFQKTFENNLHFRTEQTKTYYPLFSAIVWGKIIQFPSWFPFIQQRCSGAWLATALKERWLIFEIQNAHIEGYNFLYQRCLGRAETTNYHK